MSTDTRFVSGGTNDKPTQRDAEWLEAHQEVEAQRREKTEAGQQQGGKTLYETLQMNKAAKQEQFEESIRLKNQFRSLDADEVDFLDSVLESTRAKEAAVKKDTTQQLDAFRKQQETAEKAMREADGQQIPDMLQPSWSVGPRKRKRVRDGDFGGVKLRRISTQLEAGDQAPHSCSASSTPVAVTEANANGTSESSTLDEAAAAVAPTPILQNAKPTALGLVSYSSDEED